jgi:hypothetical protein
MKVFAHPDFAQASTPTAKQDPPKIVNGGAGRDSAALSAPRLRARRAALVPNAIPQPLQLATKAASGAITQPATVAWLAP